MEILFTVLLVLGAGAALYLRSREGAATGSRAAGATVIRAPSLGILNLLGETARPLVAEDREALGSSFRPAGESEGEVPRCDVLLLYCAIADDGRIAGSERGLRELIRDSGAQVVVVGSPNEPEAYFAAAGQKGYGQANLVMTLDRKGGAFPGFFGRLFASMFEGVSMPVAWARLAPQHADAHADAPETIFACERGQVAFAR
ncbi:MAG TPA: hypothetical protein VFQ76_01215 [Longimicrobiaceae bacterium]|nr:hypothetical protein [Longimicrobiaceae bacterium]